MATAKAQVVTGDLSPVAPAGIELPVTMTPEGRLRVDAELSVGDVALTIAEYTEDAAAPANPTGPVTMLVRRDTPVTNEVTAENDIVAWKATNKGEGRTNDADLNAVAGTTAGAAVITDANGTLQQYLRGLVTRWVNALGAGTAAAALRVVVATDQTSVPVNQAAAATGGYSYLNIAAGQATTVVKASAGTLHSIVLNSAATATNTTTVYDHASGAGTVIAIPAVVTATVPTTLLFDIAFATGLTIITATANGGNMTVCYK